MPRLRLTAPVWAGLLLALGGRPSGAIPLETFESPDPSWHVADKDCYLRVDVHQRTYDQARTGSGCEFFEYSAGTGTKILLAHPLQPASVIEELATSLWVKSSRRGLQLNVRVVLPRSNAPGTGKPITALLSGGSYETPGGWQQLRVENMKLLLDRQVRVLRSRLGPSVDPGEAYIDMIVLNAYTGTGAAQLWIDDLELDGFAAATSIDRSSSAEVNSVFERISLAEHREASLVAGPEVHVRGSILYVEGRPFFARAVEWRGEPFAHLAELGFNVLRLSVPPSREQVEEAARLRIWLVAPPSTESAAGGSGLGRVLCLAAGDHLTDRDFVSTSGRIAGMRRTSSALTRPILCHVLQGVARYAELADVILLDPTPIATSFELAECVNWFAERRRRMRPARPFWSAIQTEFSTAQQEQIGILSRGRISDMDVEPQQIWLQVFHAAAGGARGVLFRSRTRLDGKDPSSLRRAAALEVVNQYLTVLEPWLAAGNVGSPVTLHAPGYQATQLEIERSRLLIVCRVAAEQQYLVGPSAAEGPLSVPVPGKLVSDTAYRITSSGPRRIRETMGTSWKLQLEDPGLAAFVVMTDDRLVINHLENRGIETRDRLVGKETEVALLQLRETREIVRALLQRRRVEPNVEVTLDQCAALLEQGRQLLQSRDYPATKRLVHQASELIRQVRQEHWRRASTYFPSPNSSPLCTSFRTLPAHWDLAARRTEMSWGPNEMAAGGFESLEHMLDSGWTQERSLSPVIRSNVELALDSPRSGRHALQLQSWSETPVSYVEDWPVWVSSAPVPVRSGQLMRIRGWAKVPRRIAGTSDGLLVFDTMTGIELAVRIHETRGWQEFKLYRVAPSDGEMAVVMALSGTGSAIVDDLEVSLAR